MRHLIHAGHDVHVVTGAPDFVFTSEIQSPRLFIRKVSLFATIHLFNFFILKGQQVRWIFNSKSHSTGYLRMHLEKRL